MLMPITLQCIVLKKINKVFVITDTRRFQSVFMITGPPQKRGHTGSALPTQHKVLVSNQTGVQMTTCMLEPLTLTTIAHNRQCALYKACARARQTPRNDVLDICSECSPQTPTLI